MVRHESSGTSNGPLSVFKGGKIMIPSASVVNGIETAVVYDVEADSWDKHDPSPILGFYRGGSRPVVWGVYER